LSPQRVEIFRYLGGLHAFAIPKGSDILQYRWVVRVCHLGEWK